MPANKRQTAFPQGAYRTGSRRGDDLHWSDKPLLACDLKQGNEVSLTAAGYPCFSSLKPNTTET